MTTKESNELELRKEVETLTQIELNGTEGRLLCVGDIHGNLIALMQVLERASFDPISDTLITIGDLADGWPDTYKVIEYLNHLPNAIHCRGNHDCWLMEYLFSGVVTDFWKNVGGKATIESYKNSSSEDRERHYRFLSRQVNYYIDTDRNIAFVHGGFNPSMSLSKNSTTYSPSVFWNDRSLWKKAVSFEKRGEKSLNMVEDFKLVVLGHTEIGGMGSKNEGMQDRTLPTKAMNVLNVDTAAGSIGRLSLVDLTDPDNMVVYQSDTNYELYPGHPRLKVMEAIIKRQ